MPAAVEALSAVVRVHHERMEREVVIRQGVSIDELSFTVFPLTMLGFHGAVLFLSVLFLTVLCSPLCCRPPCCPSTVLSPGMTQDDLEKAFRIAFALPREAAVLALEAESWVTAEAEVALCPPSLCPPSLCSALPHCVLPSLTVPSLTVPCPPSLCLLRSSVSRLLNRQSI